MTLADTNIISTLSRVGALPLLARLVEEDRLHITPGTYNELRKAVEVGCAFLEPVLAAISAGTELDLVELTRHEILAVKDLRSAPVKPIPSPCVSIGRAHDCLPTTNGPATIVANMAFRAWTFPRSCVLSGLDGLLPRKKSASWCVRSRPKGAW